MEISRNSSMIGIQKLLVDVPYPDDSIGNGVNGGYDEELELPARVTHRRVV
jgi:hypothetical protein